MTWTTITTTRQELFDAVWTEPVDHVARRLGLSNVGLGKLCRRHNVPVPPRGYWARRMAGYRDPIPPLSNDALAHTIEITKWYQPETPTMPPEVQALLTAEQQLDALITVNPRCRIRHPLVTAARAELRAAAPNERGIVRTSSANLDIRVGKASIARAVAIGETLVAAFLVRGYHLERPSGHRPRFEIFGRWFGFRIEERASHVKTPSPAQLRRAKRFRPWDPNVKVLEPTGVLHMIATEEIHDHTCEVREWHDGRQQPVEARLNDVIVAMIGWAQYRRNQAEAERRRAEHAALLSRLDAVAEGRRQRLTAAAKAHRDFRVLADFVGELEQAAQARRVSPECSRWLRWARLYVGTMNPVAQLLNPSARPRASADKAQDTENGDDHEAD